MDLGKKESADEVSDSDKGFAAGFAKAARMLVDRGMVNTVVVLMEQAKKDVGMTVEVMELCGVDPTDVTAVKSVLEKGSAPPHRLVPGRATKG